MTATDPRPADDSDARFERVEGGLRLFVEEEGARYPVTIDPIAQQAYLKASNPGPTDHFGSSVSLSGDTAVIGIRTLQTGQLQFS